MNKKLNIDSTDNLSFTELRKNFIAGLYNEDDELALNTGTKLHDLMPSIEDIVPLLQAQNESAILLGAYIAQEEGSRAKPIFPILRDLLKSEYPEVKCEIIDCFSECSENPRDYIELTPLLKDSNKSVRLCVISAFKNFDLRKVVEIYKCARDAGNIELTQALSTYIDIHEGKLTFKDVLDSSVKASKFMKVFSYLALFNKEANKEQLLNYVGAAKDSDLSTFNEIYINERNREKKGSD